MNLAIQRIRVYVKIVLLVVLVSLTVLVAFMNRTNTVTIWFFRDFAGINVLWLMLCTGVVAIIAWWILRSSISVLNDLRSLQSEEERRKHEKEQKALAERLAAAEAQLKARDSTARRDAPTTEEGDEGPSQ